MKISYSTVTGSFSYARVFETEASSKRSSGPTPAAASASAFPPPGGGGASETVSVTGSVRSVSPPTVTDTGPISNVPSASA